MARIFMDSFQHYSSADVNLKWTGGAGSTFGVISTSGGRSGPQCMSFFDNGHATLFVNNLSTITIGAAIKLNAFAYSPLFSLQDTGSTQIDVRQNSLGGFTVTRNGTVLATTPNGLYVLGAWFYLELKATINSSGSFDLHVNSVSQASGSANTQTTGNAYANEVTVGPWSVGGSTILISDLYVNDSSGAVNTGFSGDIKVMCIYPNAEGSVLTWTPDSGSVHFSRTNEAQQDGDASYVYTNGVSNKDVYNFQDIAVTGTIDAVQHVLTARKDDAGARTIKNVTRSGGTDYDSAAAQSLTMSYGMFREVREQDPATSAPWTQSAVNAGQWGAKLYS